jgi:hypothetical protein
MNSPHEAPTSAELAGTTQEVVKACAGPCGRTLPLSRFSVDRHLKSGYRSRCRDCHRAGRGPRGKEGRSALELERELLDLVEAYTEPSLADVLARALEEVRQIGAAGERRAAQVEAVRRAVLVKGCRRVDEIVEEERLSRWVVDHALERLVEDGELETRDAFRLGDEAEETGRPVVEYHPRAYPRGEGFTRLFGRRDSADESPSLEVQP